MRTFMRNLLVAFEQSNLVECVDAGAEAAMDAENALIDDGGQGHVVKYFSAVLPRIRTAVLAEALVVEAVDLRHLSTLVIAAQQRDARRIASFVAQQQRQRLHTVMTTIHEVTTRSANAHINTHTDTHTHTHRERDR